MGQKYHKRVYSILANHGPFGKKGPAHSFFLRSIAPVRKHSGPWQLDLGHEQWLVYRNRALGIGSLLSAGVLLMENQSFELIGKLTNLVLVVRFLDALQQC